MSRDMINETSANVRIAKVNGNENTNCWTTFIRLESPDHGKCSDVVIQLPGNDDKITVNADSLIDGIKGVAYTNDRIEGFLTRIAGALKK